LLLTQSSDGPVVTNELLVLSLIRLLGALPVLRWPLAGAIIAILVDLSDLVVAHYLDLGGLPDYQAFDKAADLAYMATFLAVSLGWKGVARRVAVALFALRVTGVAVFEITGVRATLVALPNLFELWFLYVVVQQRIAPDYSLTYRRAAPVLAALAGLKLSQEYLLHIDRRLDAISVPQAFDAVRALIEGS
jgi:hypothetical protein